VSALGLGSKVWVWRHGHRHTGVVRDGFEEIAVTGQTRVSWIVGEGWREFKIPKRHQGDTFRKTDRSGYGSTVYLTEAAVDEACWRATHEHRIRRAVEQFMYGCTVAQLRQIAQIIGYDEAGAA
jgi:hypothetical protein